MTETKLTRQTCPYPGLRPFERTEAHLFFGRDSHVAAVLQRMRLERFVAVTGPSGCGKSSLIRAGVIPALEHGFLNDSEAEWKIAIMRPGGAPIVELAKAVVHSGIFTPDDATDGGKTEADVQQADARGNESVENLAASLQAGPNRLGDLLAMNAFARERQLLILVDQFEELFTNAGPANYDSLAETSCETSESPDSRLNSVNQRRFEEAQSFVRVLLHTVKRSGNKAHVLITMRSDFLGNCTQFSGLPEQISVSQYLTPRLTREQTKEAIIQPARMMDCEVDSGVVNEILNDMGNDPDQLPLMQHLLMRMWLIADGTEKGVGAIPAESKPIDDDAVSVRRSRLAVMVHMERKKLEICREAERLKRGLLLEGPRQPVDRLTRAHFKEAGLLSNSIEEQALRILNRLSPRHQAAVEHVFRQVATVSESGQIVRRTPVRLFRQILNAAPECLGQDRELVLKETLEILSAQGVNYLQPQMQVETINESLRVDLSHESVVRNWSQATKWAIEEADRALFVADRVRDAKNWEREGMKWRDLGLTSAELRKCKSMLGERHREFDDLTKQFIGRNNLRRYVAHGLVCATGFLIVCGLCILIFFFGKVNETSIALQRQLSENVHDELVRASQGYEVHMEKPLEYDISAAVGRVAGSFSEWLDEFEGAVGSSEEIVIKRRESVLFNAMLNVAEQSFPQILNQSLSGNKRLLYWSEGGINHVVSRDSMLGKFFIQRGTGEDPFAIENSFSLFDVTDGIDASRDRSAGFRIRDGYVLFDERNNTQRLYVKKANSMEKKFSCGGVSLVGREICVVSSKGEEFIIVWNNSGPADPYCAKVFNGNESLTFKRLFVKDGGVQKTPSVIVKMAVDRYLTMIAAKVVPSKQHSDKSPQGLANNSWRYLSLDDAVDISSDGMSYVLAIIPAAKEPAAQRGTDEPFEFQAFIENTEDSSDSFGVLEGQQKKDGVYTFWVKKFNGTASSGGGVERGVDSIISVDDDNARSMIEGRYEKVRFVFRCGDDGLVLVCPRRLVFLRRTRSAGEVDKPNAYEVAEDCVVDAEVVDARLVYGSKLAALACRDNSLRILSLPEFRPVCPPIRSSGQCGLVETSNFIGLCVSGGDGQNVYCRKIPLLGLESLVEGDGLLADLSGRDEDRVSRGMTDVHGKNTACISGDEGCRICSVWDPESEGLWKFEVPESAELIEVSRNGVLFKLADCFAVVRKADGNQVECARLSGLPLVWALAEFELGNRFLSPDGEYVVAAGGSGVEVRRVWSSESGESDNKPAPTDVVLAESIWSDDSKFVFVRIEENGRSRSSVFRRGVDGASRSRFIELPLLMESESGEQLGCKLSIVSGCFFEREEIQFLATGDAEENTLRVWRIGADSVTVLRGSEVRLSNDVEAVFPLGGQGETVGFAVRQASMKEVRIYKLDDLFRGGERADATGWRLDSSAEVEIRCYHSELQLLVTWSEGESLLRLWDLGPVFSSSVDEMEVRGAAIKRIEAVLTVSTASVEKYGPPYCSFFGDSGELLVGMLSRASDRAGFKRICLDSLGCQSKLAAANIGRMALVRAEAISGMHLEHDCGLDLKEPEDKFEVSVFGCSPSFDFERRGLGEVTANVKEWLSQQEMFGRAANADLALPESLLRNVLRVRGIEGARLQAVRLVVRSLVNQEKPGKGIAELVNVGKVLGFLSGVVSSTTVDEVSLESVLRICLDLDDLGLVTDEQLLSAQSILKSAADICFPEKLKPVIESGNFLRAELSRGVRERLVDCLLEAQKDDLRWFSAADHFRILRAILSESGDAVSRFDASLESLADDTILSDFEVELGKLVAAELLRISMDESQEWRFDNNVCWRIVRFDLGLEPSELRRVYELCEKAFQREPSCVVRNTLAMACLRAGDVQRVRFLLRENKIELAEEPPEAVACRVFDELVEILMLARENSQLEARAKLFVAEGMKVIDDAGAQEILRGECRGLLGVTSRLSRSVVKKGKGTAR